MMRDEVRRPQLDFVHKLLNLLVEFGINTSFFQKKKKKKCQWASLKDSTHFIGPNHN